MKKKNIIKKRKVIRKKKVKKPNVINLKEKVEKELYYFAKNITMHPNGITTLSILVTLAGVYFISQLQIYAGIALFAVAGFLDLLDGTVAKAQKKTTEFGSLFDKFADRINDFLMLCAPVFAGLVNNIVGFIAVGLILIGSYLSALLDAHTKNKKTGEGLSMRAVRIIILIIGGLLTPTFPMAWQYAFYVVIAIAGFSIGQRFAYALNSL